MIASLRNGLADGISVTKYHRSASTVRYCPLHTHLHGHSSHGLSWRFSGTVALYPPGARYVSTRTPSTTESPAEDVPHPAPNAAPLRKHKVELRPGPVKPLKTSFDSSHPKHSASSSTGQEHTPTLSQSSSEASTSTSSTASAQSVIETAKEDYYDASKHGILAPPPEGASWPRKLWHQAKELFKFYWNGVKLINTNRVRVRGIQARVKNGGAPLSRWETRFIANYKQDALKLIPFALIILIAEEAIPLVKERIDVKRREKQKNFAKDMQSVFQSIHERALAEPNVSAELLLDRTALLSYNGVFSLSTFGPPPLRVRRLKKHLNHVAEDDMLLSRENWGERLNAVELRDALEERGIVTDGLSTDGLRSRLQWWLAETQQTNDPTRQRLLLVAANAIGKHAA